MFLSRSSVTKEGYIQKEIRLALDIADEKPDGTIYLIPAKLEDCNVPNRISRFQWVDLYTRTGYERLRESLQLRMDDLNISFDSNEALPKADIETVRIPILGPIAAGLPLPELRPGANYLNDNEVRAIDVARNLLPLKEKGDDFYALEVKGDSMISAMINDGDIVVMKHATKARNGEMVAVWLPRDNEAALIYFFNEKDRYRLQPGNPTMKPIYINKDEKLEIKGKVVMVIRKVLFISK